MITINLLPESSRKPKTTSLQRFSRSPLAMGLLGCLVGVWVFLLGTRGILQMRLQALTKRLQQQQSQKTTAETLSASVKALRDQYELYQRLNRERSDWTQRLSALPQITPDGVWLTELVFDPDEGLTLQGAAIGKGGEEMVRIRRFVQDLRSHPAFASLIKDLQIESIKSELDGEVEIVNFALTGQLSAAPAKKSKKTKR